MNSDKIVVFLDSIQRTVIATLVRESKECLIVTKPVVLNVSPTQDKKLQVQLYPLFFREFTNNRDEFATWSYPYTAITTSTVELEANLLAQYRQMFQVASATPTDSGKVIKLFDDGQS